MAGGLEAAVHEGGVFAINYHSLKCIASAENSI